MKAEHGDELEESYFSQKPAIHASPVSEPPEADPLEDDAGAEAVVEPVAEPVPALRLPPPAVATAPPLFLAVATVVFPVVPDTVAPAVPAPPPVAVPPAAPPPAAVEEAELESVVESAPGPSRKYQAPPSKAATTRAIARYMTHGGSPPS